LLDLAAVPMTTVTDGAWSAAELVVAHDFNNILTAISGLGEQIAAESEGRTADRAQAIVRTAGHASSLTRGSGLLAFGRQEPQDTSRREPGALAREMSSLFDRLLGPRIAVEYAAHDYVVARVDEGGLRQALLNLVVHRVVRQHDGFVVVRSAPDEGTTFGVYLPAPLSA
jgi:signal transduction histidine kinase